MGNALVVARWRHAVVPTQGIEAVGKIVLSRLVQVLEGRRQAVGAVVVRSATKRPEGILQSLGRCHIALATQNHMGVLESAVGKTEVIQAMIQRLTGDGHTQFAHGGEIRKAHPARLMVLPENHLLPGTVLSVPGPYPPFRSAADTGPRLGVTTKEFLVNGDRADPR